jgi:hypothetical protein
MANTYRPDTDAGAVRLLLNDVGAPWVFSDAEIDAFLTLEGGSIKRAAAQAIDTNADNEALASKVLRTQDVQTDGAKLAAALHARADSLRAQATDDEEADGYFEIVDTVHQSRRRNPLIGW